LKLMRRGRKLALKESGAQSYIGNENAQDASKRSQVESKGGKSREKRKTRPYKSTKEIDK